MTHGPLIKTADLATLLLMTPERLRQLEKEGHLPPATAGVRPLRESVQGYVRFLRDEDRRSSKSASVSRVQDKRAEEIDLRLAERRRELIPLGDARAVMASLCAALVDALESVPARATRDLGQRAKIEAEIDAARARIAQLLAASEDALRTGRDPDQAAEPGSA